MSRTEKHVDSSCIIVENLLAQWESLADAAIEYHDNPDYDRGQVLRDCAREFTAIADALEGKS